MTAEQMCRYRRTADVPDELRNAKRTRRERLRALCLRILKDELPEDAEQLAKAFTREGYALLGESLRVNICPFFLAEWVLGLMRRAESAASA